MKGISQGIGKLLLPLGYIFLFYVIMKTKIIEFFQGWLTAMANLGNKVGFDGLLHIIVPSIIVVFFKIVLPWYFAIIPAVVISVVKELVYDKWLGKGECSWKDFICDLVGVVIGAG